MAGEIIGWKINSRDRNELLRRFPPRYDNVVADHITFGKSAGLTLPDVPVAEVVGIADDGEGVQALVAELSGTTERPDGSTYHITWSLADGRKAVESNDVIKTYGWDHSGETSKIRLEPASWP